jgi:FimV-like protein
MIHYYFQQLIEFAHHNSIMFVSIIITSCVAIFILTILLLNPKKVIHKEDIHAIAGDDVYVTQLDLARAYIELGKIMLAKQILETVINQGDQDQKQAAEELLLTL